MKTFQNFRKTNSSVNVPPGSSFLVCFPPPQEAVLKASRGKLHVKGAEVLMTSLMSSIETVSFCWGVAKKSFCQNDPVNGRSNNWKLVTNRGMLKKMVHRPMRFGLLRVAAL
ncbi:hypothetical protein CDAR_84271 [Caerostris darwini]|uniref:Uncharacterized protein n=1 Tax=Caerostris darwini TaxID=1538125 RepID=A0AAV4X350_9ARAC|nr:hypothetical protein CDAR_84271 [Caerostris darwini]